MHRRKFLAGIGATGGLVVLPKAAMSMPATALSPAARIPALTVPAAMRSFHTSGFGRAGDGGTASYRRVARQPAHPFALRDASGAWFEGQATGGYISPASLGAMGRTTNEGPALQRALEAAMTQGVWLRLEPGVTYVVDPSRQKGNGWMAIPEDGQSVRVDFNGATVKFADGMPDDPRRFWHIFSVPLMNARGGRGRNIPLVHLRQPRLDGNARAQPKPRSRSDFEQRALIRVAAHDGNRIERVIIEDAHIEDRIADGIMIGNSTEESDGARAPIARCDIVNPYCGPARDVVRAFIVVGSGCSHTRIVNPRCAPRLAGGRYNSIETEFSRIGRQKVTLEIEGGEVDALELGTPSDIRDHRDVRTVARNLKLRDYYVHIGGSIETENCDFAIGMSRAFAVREARHSGTTFRHTIDETGEVRQMALRADYVPAMDWREENCRHVLTDRPPASAERPAIRMLPSKAASRENYRLDLVNCSFDPRFPMAIDAYGGGTVTTRGCRMAGERAGVRTGSFGEFAGSYTSLGDDWRAVSGPVAVEIIGNTASSARHSIEGGQFGGKKVKLRGRFAQQALERVPTGIAVLDK